MDRGEQFFKLLTEAFEFFIVIILLFHLGQDILSDTVLVISSFVIVHTFNWITNNLFWSIVMFAFPNLKNRGAASTVQYLKNMAERLGLNTSITGMALYGSISRRRWHDRSDLDVRLLRAPGILNVFRANLVMMRERFIAFLMRQPTDMFLADDVGYLTKMRSDEKPVFLIKRDERLEVMFPGNQVQLISKDHLSVAAMPVVD